MKNAALKTAGIVFFVVAVVQALRFFMKVPVVAGTVEIPVWISAVAAAALLALAVWMFKAMRELI